MKFKIHINYTVKFLYKDIDFNLQIKSFKSYFLINNSLKSALIHNYIYFTYKFNSHFFWIKSQLLTIVNS